MKKILTKEFGIGISVIVAILILIFGIDYLKGINLFKPANFYIATYTNVSGLELSAPVVVDGYKVGQVRDIRFDYQNPGKIEVLLALNKNLHLPKDSKALIGSTMLSGSFIDIKLGTSKEMIPVGGNVETMYAPGLMENVTEQLMPSVNSILPRVDSLLANLNRLVADPALAQSISRLDGITADILAATSGLRVTLNRDVPAITGNAARVTYHLDTITSNLSSLSYQLKELPLSSTMSNVQEVTKNLMAFSNQLNSQTSTLGLLMNDPELYNKLNRVTADVDSLIVDIKKNPKRYISIKLL